MKDIKNIKKIVAFLMAVIMIICCSGCATWDNFKTAFIDKPEEIQSIKIGIFEPTTGADAQAAADEINGIELAHQIYPMIGDRPIELVYADNGSNVELCASAIQSLVDAQVSVILGSYKSIYTLAGSDAIKEARIPAIAITNTNPIVTQTNPYYYRVSYIDSFEETIAAKFIYEQLQTTRVAILLKEGNDYDSAMATEFVKAFETVTGEEDIVDTVSVPADIQDYGQYLVNMKYLSPDAIFFPGNLTEGENAITTAQRLGYNFTWVGTSNWDGLEIENVYYTLDYDPAKPTTGIAAIMKNAYKNVYGSDKEPSNAVALGFDAYMLALEGIKNATAQTGYAIKTAIAKVENLECSTGYLTMSDSGDPIKEVIVEKYENGEHVIVYTMLPETHGRDDVEDVENVE